MKDALKELTDEVGRTGVLSESFKTRIIALAQVAVGDAYAEGRRHPVASQGNHRFADEFAPGWFRCRCGMEVTLHEGHRLNKYRCPGPLPQETP